MSAGVKRCHCAWAPPGPAPGTICPCCDLPAKALRRDDPDEVVRRYFEAKHAEEQREWEENDTP